MIPNAPNCTMPVVTAAVVIAAAVPQAGAMVKAAAGVAAAATAEVVAQAAAAEASRVNRATRANPVPVFAPANPETTAASLAGRRVGEEAAALGLMLVRGGVVMLAFVMF